jgi:serine/threonine protein phosphatase PrpC
LGDSRLYRFRGHQLLTHTRDHSVPQALYDAGEIQASEIRHHEDRAKVLRCLGSKVPPRATISVGDPLMANDRFLLCTDGFWESVTEDEIKRDLESADSAREWLDSLALRVRARATPQQDNYSAIAVWGAA